MELEGNVLITGGAGYLGRAIIDAAHHYGWDCRLTVYSRDEEKQWRLRHKYPDVHCILGDIRDEDRLDIACAGRDIVIHTGAVKFVPQAEYNVLETTAVNVTGTYNVAMACAKGGVGRAIFISTDKAVEPVNLYGATKMVGEKLWTEMGRNYRDAGCKFATARYGNVIGSTGSLVPLFERQLRTTGRISVTDPAMTRFFMTHEDAVHCVLQALRFAPIVPGAIVGARCNAMSIGHIARILAQDAIDVIGPRAGEKKHETLLPAHECERVVAIADEAPLEHFMIVPRDSMEGLASELEGVDEVTRRRMMGVVGSEPYSSDEAPIISPEDFLTAIEGVHTLMAG